MKTIIVDPNDKNLTDKCVGEIINGGVVAFPTETVYGLGANALDFNAVDKIFKLKGRQNDNPLIIHVSGMDMAEKYCYLTDNAEKLISKFSPGPISFVLNKKPCIAGNVTANKETVAVRIPGNKIALNLILHAGVPIAAPSANKSGKVSPTTAKHVSEDFNGEIPYIIDGGSCEVGLESTVCDLTLNVPVILRPGAVTLEMIKEILPDAIYHTGIISRNEIPSSPGMKYPHYCPSAQLTLVCGKDYGKIANYIIVRADSDKKNGKNPVIICLDENQHKYENIQTICVGKKNEPDKIAKNIFWALRQADHLSGAGGTIYCENIEDAGIGIAINNRLKKACSGRIVKI